MGKLKKISHFTISNWIERQSLPRGRNSNKIWIWSNAREIFSFCLLKKLTFYRE